MKYLIVTAHIDWGVWDNLECDISENQFNMSAEEVGTFLKSLIRVDIKQVYDVMRKVINLDVGESCQFDNYCIVRYL